MRVLVLVVCVLTFGLASVAMANIPDLSVSTASTAYHAGGGVGIVALFNLANGAGSDFAHAGIGDGTVVNGTVTLYLRNSVGGGIADFPAEDLWLASIGGGLVACTGGTIADSITDSSGMTQWADPMNAYGFSTTQCQVLVAGDALTSSTGMDLHFNSADISGDGLVDLIDIGLFAADLGTYNFRSDLVFDGVIDLPDLGRLASGIGTVCP